MVFSSTKGEDLEILDLWVGQVYSLGVRYANGSWSVLYSSFKVPCARMSVGRVAGTRLYSAPLLPEVVARGRTSRRL